MKQRFIILDALRGIALLGICLANFPEFSLYTFLDSEVTGAMPTAEVDRIVKYFQYIFIDGKFYTMFSVLFGIGFSILLSKAAQINNKGLLPFYRRMAVLFLIGLFHLLFLWAGDILILYALVGFFLPLFRYVPDGRLLKYGLIFLFVPVVIDGCVDLFGWELAAIAVRGRMYFHSMVGIDEGNFPVWLVEKQQYMDIFRFNWGGSFVRLQEFIEGNRAFRVLGLFLVGWYIGRKGIYRDPGGNRRVLEQVMRWGFIVGMPGSLLYAWSAMYGHPLGLAVHSLIYTLSVFPLGFAYMAAVFLWFHKNPQHRFFTLMAAPGRMALTNYLMQSVFGIIIFYGIGFGLGARTGLVYVELIAAAVFGLQVVYSNWWLRYNYFGPFEWGWRMLTYGKWFKIRKGGSPLR